MKSGNFYVIKPESGFQKAPNLLKNGKSNIVTVCTPSPNRERVNTVNTVLYLILSCNIMRLVSNRIYLLIDGVS